MDGQQLVGHWFVGLDEVVEVRPRVIAAGEAAARGGVGRQMVTRWMRDGVAGGVGNGEEGPQMTLSRSSAALERARVFLCVCVKYILCVCVKFVYACMCACVCHEAVRSSAEAGAVEL